MKTLKQVTYLLFAFVAVGLFFSISMNQAAYTNKTNKHPTAYRTQSEPVKDMICSSDCTAVNSLDSAQALVMVRAKAGEIMMVAPPRLIVLLWVMILMLVSLVIYGYQKPLIVVSVRRLNEVWRI